MKHKYSAVQQGCTSSSGETFIVRAAETARALHSGFTSPKSDHYTMDLNVQWFRTGSPNFFIQGPHKPLHNSPRAGHLAESDCFEIS